MFRQNDKMLYLWVSLESRWGFEEVYYPRSGRILYYSVRLKNGVERNCKDGELEKRYNK